MVTSLMYSHDRAPMLNIYGSGRVCRVMQQTFAHVSHAHTVPGTTANLVVLVLDSFSLNGPVPV